jgi:hypothetical protein
MGPTGPTGPQGEIGPTGPTGVFSADFIHVYSESEQTILTEFPIVFDGVRYVMGGLGMAPFTSNVYVWQPGYYNIQTLFHHIEACQFQIFKNGVAFGSPFSSPTGATMVTYTSIIYIDASDLTEPTSLSPTGFATKIEVRNHTSYNPAIRLDNPGGSALADLTASLTMFRLA